MTNSLPSRLWVYQRERFPLAAHGVLSVVFAVGVACAGAALAGEAPRLGDLVGASVLVLGLFAQLRVADEWKDHETDRKYRPERPVPRGLVTLTELTGVAVGIAVVQMTVAFALGWTVVVALALAWLWGSAMTAEFGVGEWLRTRPLVTMVSHGLIVPLIALAALACAVDAWPPGAGWILAASTFAGNVIEIGRKVRAPEDEREGVETYSAAWGPRRAGVAWAVAGVLASGGAGLVLHTAGTPVWPALALA
ncbi:MAG: UbiA family prenyltransferase, partial [Bacteroidota bacterium]